MTGRQAAWATANSVSLRYELSGDGPPMVLLHEMGGTLQSWDAMPPLLPGRQVLRYDSRGAGLSEKIVGAVTLDMLVEDLVGLLDALGWRAPATLVGCAVGAAVALAFAARHPARVAAVVAIAPATGLAPARHAEAHALADWIITEGLRPRVLERVDRSFPASYRTDPALFDAYRAIMLANDPVSYAAIYRMLAGMDLAGDLPRITCPVLVLAGDTDPTRPPDQCRLVADVIPGAAFQVVASGHVMALLTPGLLAASLRHFLTGTGVTSIEGNSTGHRANVVCTVGTVERSIGFTNQHGWDGGAGL